MKSKVEFYKIFFEELEKKGFGVAQPSSPDYVVDIQFKGKTIAFYTKGEAEAYFALWLQQGSSMTIEAWKQVSRARS